MGDRDIDGAATGRVVEAGAIQTSEGEPLDGVILSCSVSSVRRIGGLFGERVVVIPLSEYLTLTGAK